MSQDESDDDRNTLIFKERASGKPVRELAIEHGLTRREIEKIVKGKADELLNAESLRVSTALAARRLEDEETEFHVIALRDKDPTAAAVSIKANERRMTMLGGNAPLGHSVRMIGEIAPAPETSTDQLFRAIRELRSEVEPPADPKSN